MLSGIKGGQDLCPDSGLCVSRGQKQQGRFLGENRVQIVELSEGEKQENRRTRFRKTLHNLKAGCGDIARKGEPGPREWSQGQWGWRSHNTGLSCEAGLP